MGGGKGGLSVEDVREEASSMLSGLRSGNLSPDAALAQIADDEKVGFYSPENAAYLRSLVTSSAQAAPNKKTATTESMAQYNKSMPSDKAIEAEAKKNGYPTIDYKSWYKSPQGRAAGIDFNTWRSLYGPRLQ
jgi:hypothetical protein